MGGDGCGGRSSGGAGCGGGTLVVLVVAAKIMVLVGVRILTTSSSRSWASFTASTAV